MVSTLLTKAESGRREFLLPTPVVSLVLVPPTPEKKKIRSKASAGVVPRAKPASARPLASGRSYPAAVIGTSRVATAEVEDYEMLGHDWTALYWQREVEMLEALAEEEDRRLAKEAEMLAIEELRREAEAEMEEALAVADEGFAFFEDDEDEDDDKSFDLIADDEEVLAKEEQRRLAKLDELLAQRDEEAPRCEAKEERDGEAAVAASTPTFSSPPLIRKQHRCSGRRRRSLRRDSQPLPAPVPVVVAAVVDAPKAKRQPRRKTQRDGEVAATTPTVPRRSARLQKLRL